jgi:hypothetical protein
VKAIGLAGLAFLLACGTDPNPDFMPVGDYTYQFGPIGGGIWGHMLVVVSTEDSLRVVWDLENLDYYGTDTLTARRKGAAYSVVVPDALDLFGSPLEHRFFATDVGDRQVGCALYEVPDDPMTPAGHCELTHIGPLP